MFSPFQHFQTTHTLSCPPRKLPTTYGPTCTRCSCAHVSLPKHRVSVESSQRIHHSQSIFRKRQWAAGQDIRFGAVSSAAVQLASHLHTALRPPGLSAREPAHTNTRGLPDIDGQIGLRPARLGLIRCCRGGEGGLSRLPTHGGWGCEFRGFSRDRALQQNPESGQRQQSTRACADRRRKGKSTGNHTWSAMTLGESWRLSVLATPKPLGLSLVAASVSTTYTWAFS